MSRLLNFCGHFDLPNCVHLKYLCNKTFKINILTQKQEYDFFDFFASRSRFTLLSFLLVIFQSPILLIKLDP